MFLKENLSIFQLKQSVYELIERETFEEAEKVLNQVLMNHPLDEEICKLKGRLAIEFEKYDEALLYLAKCLEFNFENARAIFLRGIVKLRQDNEKMAMEDFHTALKYDPEHVDALVNIGLIHMDHKEIKEAGGYLNKALKLSPNSKEVLLLKEEVKKYF